MGEVPMRRGECADALKEHQQRDNASEQPMRGTRLKTRHPHSCALRSRGFIRDANARDAANPSNGAEATREWPLLEPYVN